jgi:hypothetical protein
VYLANTSYPIWYRSASLLYGNALSTSFFTPKAEHVYIE